MRGVGDTEQRTCCNRCVLPAATKNQHSRTLRVNTRSKQAGATGRVKQACTKHFAATMFLRPPPQLLSQTRTAPVLVITCTVLHDILPVCSYKSTYRRVFGLPVSPLYRDLKFFLSIPMCTSNAHTIRLANPDLSFFLRLHPSPSFIDLSGPPGWKTSTVATTTPSPVTVSNETLPWACKYVFGGDVPGIYGSVPCVSCYWSVLLWSCARG